MDRSDGKVLIVIFTPSVTEREWGNRCFHRRGWGRRFCFGAEEMLPFLVA